jgi:hypothetical protein
MKVKTMVYLEREQLKALRARARAERISLAELVRRIVDRHLEQPGAPPPVSPDLFARIVGLGTSGRTDVADRHDDYLAAALARDHDR